MEGHKRKEHERGEGEGGEGCAWRRVGVVIYSSFVETI